jgi:hypothetical protein
VGAALAAGSARPRLRRHRDLGRRRSGAWILPVTTHAPVLHSPWNDDPDSRAWTTIRDPAQRAAEFAAHEETYGYLDAGTESLLNAAIATTPHATQALDPTAG